MSKSNNNASSLLAAIKRQTLPENPPATSQPELTPPSKPETKGHSHRNGTHPVNTPVAKRLKGKAVQFWFHDEDRRLIRELAAWLAGQGERPTDSLVVRAALRMADTGGDFLAAYRRASSLDGRLKRPVKE